MLRLNIYIGYCRKVRCISPYWHDVKITVGINNAVTCRNAPNRASFGQKPSRGRAEITCDCDFCLYLYPFPYAAHGSHILSYLRTWRLIRLFRLMHVSSQGSKLSNSSLEGLLFVKPQNVNLLHFTCLFTASIDHHVSVRLSNHAFTVQ